MRVLTFILFFFCFELHSQQFPTVIDTIPPSGQLSSYRMIEGGFELIGISNSFKEFDISNLEKLYKEHLYRRIYWVEEHGDSFESNYQPIEYQDSIYDMPPPPMLPPQPKSQEPYKIGVCFEVYVDTTQIVAMPEYTDNSNISLNRGQTVKEIYDNEINFLSKYYKPSKNMVQAYPIMIKNVSDSIRNVETQEGWIYMVQEAMHPDGYWKPIEYINYSVVCGNSRGSERLIPNEYLISKIYKYTGDFKTKLRIRFATNREVYFSNEFWGKINLTQFKIPNYLPELTDRLNDHFLSN